MQILVVASRILAGFAFRKVYRILLRFSKLVDGSASSCVLNGSERMNFYHTPYATSNKILTDGCRNGHLLTLIHLISTLFAFM